MRDHKHSRGNLDDTKPMQEPRNGRHGMMHDAMIIKKRHTWAITGLVMWSFIDKARAESRLVDTQRTNAIRINAMFHTAIGLSCTLVHLLVAWHFVRGMTRMILWLDCNVGGDLVMGPLQFSRFIQCHCRNTTHNTRSESSFNLPSGIPWHLSTEVP